MKLSYIVMTTTYDEVTSLVKCIQVVSWVLSARLNML